MLAYVRPMLAYVGLGWAYVGPMLAPLLAPRWKKTCWPYVEPSWRLCWAYVGDMLAIFGLFWGYVRQFMLKNLPIQLFTIFSFPQSKNHEKTLRFLDIAKLKFSAAEGPKTL